MLAENSLEFFGGIFVFNPLDDECHLERIENNINSICHAASLSKHRIKISIYLNKSKILHLENISGIGQKTEEKILSLKEKYNFEILEYFGENAISKGYNLLLQHGHKHTDAKKIVVFADDYIMPYFWFDLIKLNFDKKQDASFMMPCTSYVAQKNLEMNFEPFPEWDIRIAEKGDHKKMNIKTIYGGVKIDHINEIAKKFIKNEIILYSDPPSFETTVFTRELIDQVGYIFPEYYSCFYDNDYFNMINKKMLRGYIAKNCFIFHYGKGGTKSLYKETADEKFKESPVNYQLLSDIEVWNKRWGKNVKPWWGKKDE